MRRSFSALQRAEIAEIFAAFARRPLLAPVSVLFNEPKLLKSTARTNRQARAWVSVLFNEPKLLKSSCVRYGSSALPSFSALQRAEIAEIPICVIAPERA